VLAKLLILIWNAYSSSKKEYLYQEIGKMLESKEEKYEVVEEGAGRCAIKEIKHYVISNIFTVIQGKPLTKIEISEWYKIKINRRNLRTVKQNLLLVLENCELSSPLEINQ
jgi:hypothetical protein